jgi:hypothetical protein
MKTLKVVLIVIVAVIISAVAIAFLLPREIMVERSALIIAPQEVVFEQVNVLRNWEKWSPWHEIDPDMVITYEGPEMGAGASYSWSSEDPRAGKGKLTITESIPYSLIKTKLDFMEQGTANAEYRFLADEGGTLMTWSMRSDMGNNPIGRYMGLFMDKWLGNDFEKGMAKLQAMATTTH